MLEIKKIRLNELAEFVGSNFFLHLTIVPISPSRVKSYIKNPRSKPTDVVLYLGFIGDKLVAFRSLFADVIVTKSETIRFAWCSGNWVHPDFRRKGFSEQLLKEAFSDWQGKLMFTNYAEESEKLYLKTGLFFPVHQFEGVRGYLFSKTKKLVPRANKNSFYRAVFTILDVFITAVSFLRSKFFFPKINSEIQFETLEFPDEQCYQFIRGKTSGFILNRSEAELKWIFNFPWISKTDRYWLTKYPFSLHSESFYYRTVKVFLNNTFSGFFIFSVREGHLKTLYFLVEGNFEKEIADFLKKFCIEFKIERVTIYNQRIAGQIFKQKFPFLRAKKYGQKIYSTFEIKEAEKGSFQDGDGDLFFT